MVGRGSKRGRKSEERGDARYTSNNTTAGWEECATARIK